MADTQIVCRASYLSKDKAVPSLLAPLRRQVFHEKLLHFLNWFQGSYLRHVLDKNHTFDAKSNSTVPALPLADAMRPLSISSKLLTIFGLFVLTIVGWLFLLSEIKRYLTFHRDGMASSDLSPLTSPLSEGWVVTKLIFSCFPPPMPSLSVSGKKVGAISRFEQKKSK